MKLSDIRNGKLAALLELRDQDVRGEIQNLDLMTVNFTDMVNEVHRTAFSSNGRTGIDFFSEYPFVNNLAGNYDLNGDGEYDHSYVFRINGQNVMDPEQQTGLGGNHCTGRPGRGYLNRLFSNRSSSGYYRTELTILVPK